MWGMTLGPKTQRYTQQHLSRRSMTTLVQRGARAVVPRYYNTIQWTKQGIQNGGNVKLLIQEDWCPIEQQEKFKKAVAPLGKYRHEEHPDNHCHQRLRGQRSKAAGTGNNPEGAESRPGSETHTLYKKHRCILTWRYAAVNCKPWIYLTMKHTNHKVGCWECEMWIERSQRQELDRTMWIGKGKQISGTNYERHARTQNADRAERPWKKLDSALWEIPQVKMPKEMEILGKLHWSVQWEHQKSICNMSKCCKVSGTGRSLPFP